MPKNFSGRLGCPSIRRRAGLLQPAAETAKLIAADSAEEEKLLLLLCQHYQIPRGRDMFRKLSFALARDFVPAFKDPLKRGRRSKWTDGNRAAFVVEMERLINKSVSGRGAAWAATQLAKREPWKSFVVEQEHGEGNPAETLRKVYQDFKQDNYAKMMRRAFKYHEHAGTVDEWDALVTDLVKNPHPH